MLWTICLSKQNQVKILLLQPSGIQKNNTVQTCTLFTNAVLLSCRSTLSYYLFPFKYQPTTFSLGYFVFSSFVPPTFFFVSFSLPHPHWTGPDSIGWFREDQAFSPSYNLAHTPPPLPLVSSTSDTQWKTEKEKQLAEGSGGREWGRCQTIYYGEKAWSSIKHSTLSDLGFADNRTGKEKRCIVLTATLQWDSLRGLDDCRNRVGGGGRGVTTQADAMCRRTNVSFVLRANGRNSAPRGRT
jgi:hypothetical protein